MMTRGPGEVTRSVMIGERNIFLQDVSVGEMERAEGVASALTTFM